VGAWQIIHKLVKEERFIAQPRYLQLAPEGQGDGLWGCKRHNAVETQDTRQKNSQFQRKFKIRGKIQQLAS
jgi:hypothetical protein